MQKSGIGWIYDRSKSLDQTRRARGRILFDKDGNWIYDGDELAIPEHEQIAKFILKHT